MRAYCASAFCEPSYPRALCASLRIRERFVRAFGVRKPFGSETDACAFFSVEINTGDIHCYRLVTEGKRKHARRRSRRLAHSEARTKRSQKKNSGSLAVAP